MKTFDNFRKVINESDYILSEAQRYLEILLEKDSEALKQYKASKKSFQKGFGKNIKPTVVQPGLDLYKAGGPFVPDKTTFADTGKKVPKMEKKPQFGTPKTTTKTGAPDRTLVKKAIKDVKDSERRLFQKGLGKGTAGVKGVKGKKGISLARQRGYTKEIIKDLSAKTTQSDARIRGASTEGSAGASSSSKTVTPTKGVKQSEVSQKAKDFTKEINQKRTSTTTSKTPLFNKVKPKGDGLVKNSKGIGNKYRGNSPEAIQLRRQAIAARSGSGVVVRDKVTSSDRVNKGFTSSSKNIPQIKTKRVKSTIFNTSPSDYGTASYYKRQGKDAFDLKKNPITKSTSKGPQLPNFVKNKQPKHLNLRTGNINVTKTKGAIDLSKVSPSSRQFAYTGSALVKKSPKILKPVTGGLVKFGTKVGRSGRLGILGGIAATALSPAGRQFIGTALAGGGLSYLLNRKGPPKLKVGDGITKTTNMPSKYQPKGAKDGKIPYTDVYGKKKTMGTGDIRFRFGLTGSKSGGKKGGRIENQKDIARVKSIQKKYIDDYNKKASRNPFKKSIKYTVNKDGSYNVTPPKAK